MPFALDKLQRHDFEEALRSISSTISKCVKVKPKLERGTPQHTLLARRIAALRIAAALIERELRAPGGAHADRTRRGDRDRARPAK